MIFRVLIAVNVATWASDLLWPLYAHALANGPLNKFVVGWLVISTAALPLWAAIEVLWMRHVPEERLALWIDAVLAVVWLLFFWVRIMYEFTHRVMF